MRYVLTIFVFFAFTIGASGFAKSMEAHNSLNKTSMQVLQTMPHESLTKCCSGEEDTSETQKPRCMGDVCITLPSTSVKLLGIGNKLHILETLYHGTHLHTAFLRPPIA